MQWFLRCHYQTLMSKKCNWGVIFLNKYNQIYRIKHFRFYLTLCFIVRLNQRHTAAHIHVVTHVCTRRQRHTPLSSGLWRSHLDNSPDLSVPPRLTLSLLYSSIVFPHEETTTTSADPSPRYSERSEGDSKTPSEPDVSLSHALSLSPALPWSCTTNIHSPHFVCT